MPSFVTHIQDAAGFAPFENSVTLQEGQTLTFDCYGGKLMPSFPWDSTKPHRATWVLKMSILPWVYWNPMFKG